jgi:hypothetical protein
MTTITATATAAPVVSGPRWPLVVAPLVGLIYYLVIVSAFSTAIRDVVFSTSDLDQMLGAKWGTHWIYHLVAEGVAVAFATFVAGGMGRQRAAMAGLIGGLGISLWWAAWLAVVLYLHFHGGVVLFDPWYQSAIGVAGIILAPVIGYALGDVSREVSTNKPGGFAGIPRAHFLWLWFPAYWYCAAMIGPFLKYYMNGLIDTTPSLEVLALYLIPFACFLGPLVLGLALLSGDSPPMRPAFRHTLGPLVLVVGWGIAAAIQYGIILFVNWLSGASS